jgi:hypothetical protein
MIVSDVFNHSARVRSLELIAEAAGIVPTPSTVAKRS